MTTTDTAQPATHSYTCPWCGTVTAGAPVNCPACGSPVDVRAITTRSGWIEMPGGRDMARIQFGNSACQIEGTYVPVIDMNLAAGDWVYFNHHVLLWKDLQVAINVMPLQNAWQRVFAGMPIIMMQAQGPGHIAFSRDAPGELIALPIQQGHTVDVREHAFVVATGHVVYDWFRVYPMTSYMDRFSAPGGPGLLVLHGKGNIFIRHLAAHQTVLVRPSALLFKDSTVEMRLNTEYSSGYLAYGTATGDEYIWLRLHGPGRVALQSSISALEDVLES